MELGRVLSKDHEQQRQAQGRATLRRFFAQQQRHPEQPTWIEESFSVKIDDILVNGRWDRVDRRPDGAVMIDYKSSDVTEQNQADRRAKDSLQMAFYAMAWHALHGELPHHVELRFLETGLIGSAILRETDVEACLDQLREAARSIRARDFHATPSEFSCHWCAYNTICPASAV